MAGRLIEKIKKENKNKVVRSKDFLNRGLS